MIYKNKFWHRKTSSIALLHTHKTPQFELSDALKQQLRTEHVDSRALQEIINTLFHYDVLPSTNMPVLICWFVGPAAILIENLSEHLIGQICHEVLCSYLNISPEKYPLVQTLR